MKYRELISETNEEMKERLELVMERVKEISINPETKAPYDAYYRQVAAYLTLLYSVYEKACRGELSHMSERDGKACNEALFAEINAYHSDIVEYANKKRVWITSPTTLMSTFTVIQVLLKNMERDKYTSVIHEELNKLGIEFSRYKERWDKLSRSIETVNKDVENINITTDKISKRFQSISSVEISDKIK